MTHLSLTTPANELEEMISNMRHKLDMFFGSYDIGNENMIFDISKELTVVQFYSYTVQNNPTPLLMEFTGRGLYMHTISEFGQNENDDIESARDLATSYIDFAKTAVEHGYEDDYTADSLINITVKKKYELGTESIMTLLDFKELEYLTNSTIQFHVIDGHYGHNALSSITVAYLDEVIESHPEDKLHYTHLKFTVASIYMKFNNYHDLLQGG